MKINEILKEVFEKISPPKEDLEFIGKSLKKFLNEINERKKRLKIDAEIFIGGSYAKRTLIKKKKYDIDIFLRFDKKYKKEDLSELTKKIIKNSRNVKKVHGSRDYFQIYVSPSLFFEIVPVIKVKKPENAQNITDLSCSHVRYINKKIKSKKLLEEIMIAKAFCYATDCYGAESYINGFSGYSIELLVYYYGSFLNFIKKIIKIKDKEIIDIEKLHKNKSTVLMDLNSSKLQSPIILIDPTYKQRNALAALSKETLKKFQEECREFLKKPSIKIFEKREIDIDSLREKAEKKKLEFVLITAKTEKQEGDVAGSKLFKFYNHLAEEIQKYFEVKEKYFEYSEGKEARYIFITNPKKEIIISGPFVDDKTNVKIFKKKHKKTFVKNKRIYSKKKIDFGIEKFLKNWKTENKKLMNDMSIEEFEI